MFVNIQGIKKQVTLPSYIYDDERVSLGAKGLYAQLFYSNKDICSLEDLAKFTSSSVEDVKKYFNELAEVGYLEMKNDNCKLVQKAPKKVDEDVTEKAEKYAETTQPKPANKYETMVAIINGYQHGQDSLDPMVCNLLITYFEKWLNRRGRFAEGNELHGHIVRAKIGELISLHLSPEDQMASVQQSIDREWFKFAPPINKSTSPVRKTTSFDQLPMVSNSYTAEEAEDIKRRAEALEALGQKGVF